MAAVVVAVTAAASAEAVAFVAAALTVAFAVAGFTVPLPTAVFVAVAFVAVGDPYNQSVYKAVLDTPTSWLDKFSSVWLVGDYYYSSIDGASDDGTRRVIREHKRAHGLPEGWQDRSTTAKRTD